MPTGSATPYIAIFNAQGEVIRDPESSITLGSLVTLFEYIYEEEKVDKGHIEISTKNPNLCALTDLGYQQGLQLQWGYIYPNGTGYYGPIRRVIVTGQKVTFGQRGVNIQIEFADAAELLKNQPSSHYDSTKGFVEYWRDLCKGIPIGIEVVDFKGKQTIKTKVAQKVTDGSEIRQEQPEYEDILSRGTPRDPLTPTTILQKPSTSKPTAVGVKLLEFNPETQALTETDPDNFRRVYVKDLEGGIGAIVGTSRNKYYQLKDAIGGLSNGPYFMDSRDGRLVIHNAQSTREITKVYNYWGGDGELLEFSVESQFVKKSTEVKQSTDIDPDDKSVDTTLVQGVTDPNQGNEDGKDIDTYLDWYGDKPKQKNNWNIFERSWDRDKTRVEKKPMPPMIDAKADAAMMAQKKNSFNSLADAKKYYTEHPQISQEEIDKYFSDQMAQWREDSKKPLSATRGLAKIPPFKITRKVKIFTEVFVDVVANRYAYYHHNTPEGPQQTQEFINAIQSGQLDLTNPEYDRPWWIPGSNPTSMGNKYYEKTGYKKGWALLSAVPGLKILDKTPGYRTRHQIMYETEITLELNGIDVIAGATGVNMGTSLANSVNESISNQVKAQAQVIGDPVLESSMNIQIQNVSDKYQGLWYSKKVIHTISDQGYLCNIEFVQRTIPVSTVTIRSTVSKRDYAKDLIEASKQAKETGSYLNTTKISKEVQKQLNAKPEDSVVAQIDPRTNEVIYSREDMVSGYYITTPSGKVEYDAEKVLQDLQKTQK